MVEIMYNYKKMHSEILFFLNVRPDVFTALKVIVCRDVMLW